MRNGRGGWSVLSSEAHVKGEKGMRFAPRVIRKSLQDANPIKCTNPLGTLAQPCSSWTWRRNGKPGFLRSQLPGFVDHLHFANGRLHVPVLLYSTRALAQRSSEAAR